MSGRRSLLILGWHNVRPTPAFPGPGNDDAQRFRRQLAWLRRTMRVLPLEEAVDGLRSDALPSRAVALTFDDGYLDNATVAVDLLEERQLPATFFLCPDFLDGTRLPWWERLAVRRRDAAVLATQLKLCDADTRESFVDRVEATTAARELMPPMMDWNHAHDLVRRGFGIGSHSTAHAILSREEAAAQTLDLQAARDRLRRRLGVPVHALAYPNGRAEDYDVNTIAAAAAAGHRYAVTTVGGCNRPDAEPFELRRVVVDAAWPVSTLVQHIAKACLAQRKDRAPVSPPTLLRPPKVGSASGNGR